MSHSTFAELAIAEGWTRTEQHAQLVDAYWDVYKGAYGHRPRHIDFESMSVEELAADFEVLNKDAARAFELEEQEEREHQQWLVDQKRGYVQADVELMLLAGAGDHPTAVRWAKQANA